MVRGLNRSGDGIVFGIRWEGGRRPRPLLPVLLAALVAVLAPAAAQARPAEGAPGAAARDTLVVPAAGHSADARALVRRLGGRPGRRIVVAGGFAARVPADRIAALRGAAVVRLVAPDVALSVRGDAAAVAKAAAASTTVRAAAGVQPLRDAGVDGSGVGIALVDSGAMIIPGLDDGQVVTGPDFSTDASDPDLRGLDGFGHGTHLAGVIAGHDGAGLDGVAPGARVVSVKVANAGGQTSLLRVLGALDWVRRNSDRLHLRVVNLSLGVDGADVGYVRDPLAYAAEQLWRRGLVVVAAAGNRGPGAGRLDMPAADPFIIAAGALDTAGTPDTADDTVAGFSSRSATRPPDVVAPATGIVSLRVPGATLDTAFPAARIGDRYFRGSGTSQAAAVVSGVAALLLQQRPDLTPDQVKALLEAGARPVAVDGAVAAAEGAGAVDAARSAALDAPGRPAAAQHFPAAVLDLGMLDGADRLVRRAFGEARWSGSTWSGSTWSGSTWSGSTWSGSTWSGSTWSGSTWSAASWGGA